MKPWVAKAICDATSSLNCMDDYSGRGMYGAETSAVTGELRDFVYAVGYAARELADEDLADEFLDAVRSVRTDSMGREAVFY